MRKSEVIRSRSMCVKFELNNCQMPNTLNMTFKYPLIAIVLFSMFTSSFATFYVSVQDGPWGSNTTWTTVTGALPNCSASITGPNSYVSSFFPTPVPTIPGNWFTSGQGDTILIRHNITMTHNIFVRDSDMVIIDTCGVLSAGGAANNSSFYNLSDGQAAFSYGSGIQAGVYISGQLNVQYIRNNSSISLESTGLITLDSAAGGSGSLDNYSDIFISGDIIVTNGNIEHNAGDLWIYSGGNIEIYGNGTTGGNFNNRSVIRNLFPDSCIRLLGGSFINLLGGTIIGSGGVSADLDVDNSANPPGNWSGVTYCAGQNAINLPGGLEDCSHPCALPLPVSLISFEATPTGDGGVLLEWETQWEVNAANFIVEKSIDQETWNDAGLLPAAGTTYEKTPYVFIDEYPYGITHYRLKQTDLNGEFAYTEIKTVILDDATLEFDMYPNPADNMLTVNVRPGENLTTVLTIYDNFGKEMKRLELDVLHKNIDVSDLTPGLYIVNVMAGTEKVSRKLAIK